MKTRDSGSWNPHAARAVAHTVVVHGPLSRSDIARRLGLSPASLTRLTKPLIEQGLLIEADSVPDPVHGRRVRPLDVAPGLNFIGVKIALDAVHGVLTDGRARIVQQITLPLHSTGEEEVMQQAIEIISRLSTGKVHSVGVSLGGHTDDHSSVALSRSLGWQSVPLGEKISRATGRPVIVENDVTALTLLFHHFSESQASDRFALVTVGVGVGCGLVLNGEVVRQLDALSPSPSMLVLNPAGPTVPEGPRGSALAYLASTNVAIAASAACGRVLSFDDAMDLARNGDPRALAVVTEAASYLGRFVAGIATINYVTKFVLSGEGIAIAEVCEPAMRNAIVEVRPTWSGDVDLSIVHTTMSDWARGAAAVAITAAIDRYSADERW